MKDYRILLIAEDEESRDAILGEVSEDEMTIINMEMIDDEYEYDDNIRDGDRVIRMDDRLVDILI